MGLWKTIRAVFRPESSIERVATGSTTASPEEQFAELVLGLTRRLPFVTHADPHPTKPFTLSVGLVGGGEAAELYLGNLFAETRELGPDERVARVGGLLSAMEPTDPLGWDEACEVLVPLLRSVGYAGAAGRALASEPFAPFLVVVLGIDHESTTQVVTAEALSDWGVTFAQARDRACEVLAAHAEPGDVEDWDSEAEYPIFTIGRDDSYQSSRLMLPGFLASFRDRVHGNPVAIIPHRTLLVVAGDADAAAVLRLLETAEREYRASPRSLSPDLYTIDAGDRVIPWEPPPGHPHAALARRNRLLLAGSEYSQQREQLTEILAERGDDVYVAAFSILVSNDGSMPVSYCVLAENVPTLLPPTDLVVFARENPPPGASQHVMVRFEDARRIAGEGFFAAEPDVVPELLRASKWPDPETLAKLTEAAVELPDGVA
jgi:hypothetical protein